MKRKSLVNKIVNLYEPKNDHFFSLRNHLEHIRRSPIYEDNLDERIKAVNLALRYYLKKSNSR